MTHAEAYGVAKALIMAHLSEPDAQMRDGVLSVLGRLQEYLPEQPWFETLCDVYPAARRWHDEWARFYGDASSSTA